MDALSHNLEAYCSPFFHPMAAGIALEGMRMIKEYLPQAVADGADLQARQQMLVAVSYTHLDVYKRQVQGGRRAVGARRGGGADTNRVHAMAPARAGVADAVIRGPRRIAPAPCPGAPARLATTCLLYTSRCV